VRPVAGSSWRNLRSTSAQQRVPSHARWRVGPMAVSPGRTARAPAVRDPSASSTESASGAAHECAGSVPGSKTSAGRPLQYARRPPPPGAHQPTRSCPPV